MNVQAIIILKLSSNLVPGGLLIPQTPLDPEDAVALGLPEGAALTADTRTSIMTLSGHTVGVGRMWSTVHKRCIPYAFVTPDQEKEGKIWEEWKSFVPASRAATSRSWEGTAGYLSHELESEGALSKAARGAALPAVAQYPFENRYGRQNIDVHEIWHRLSYDLEGFIDDMTQLVMPPLPTTPSSTDAEEILENIKFTFHQDIPSALWLVGHELGAYPMVQVIDGTTMQVVPDDQYEVTHVSVNNLTIEWPGAAERVGLVRLA